MFKPSSTFARIYDMQHDPATGTSWPTRRMRGKRHRQQLPFTQADWWTSAARTDTLLENIGGVVHPRRRRTVGEMWSLFDGQDVSTKSTRNSQEHPQPYPPGLAQRSLPRLGQHRPKGDRSKPPQEQDPDMLLHVVKETDAGISCAAPSMRPPPPIPPGLPPSRPSPTGGNKRLFRYAVGFICDLGLAELKVHLPHRHLPAALLRKTIRSPIASTRSITPCHPSTDGADPLGKMCLFYRHTKARSACRAHRATATSAFAFVQRNLKLADMDDRRARHARQIRLYKQQAAAVKLSQLASTAYKRSPAAIGCRAQPGTVID